METNYCACGCGKEILLKSKWAKGHNPNKRSTKLDYKKVVNEYETLNSLEKVAKIYGCSLQNIYYFLQKNGYEFKKVNWDNLLDDYKDLKTTKAVAEKYGCSHWTVSKKLYELHGVKCNHNNKTLEKEVGVGRYGELIAVHALKDSKDMNENSIRGAYDLEWNDMKIDVKTSRLLKLNKSREYRGYVFNTSNKQCDAYLLIFLDEGDFPIKIALVKSEEVKTKYISVSENKLSRFEKYTLEVNIDAEYIENLRSTREVR